MFPKRLILFHTPNGIDFGAGAPRAFEMGPKLQAMSSDVLVVMKLDIKAADDSYARGDDHDKGPAVSFTAHITKDSAKPLGPSIDRHIISIVKPDTPLQSLDLGVQSGGGILFGTSGQGIPCENSPSGAFDRVFARAASVVTPTAGGATTAGPSSAELLRLRRKSIFDHITGELNALRMQLTPEESPKLEGHLESIRTLEKRLTSTPSLPSPLPTPSGSFKCGTAPGGASGFPAIGAAQLDILAQAIACGQTRFGTIRWSNRVSGVKHTWAGVSNGHHDVAHGTKGEVVGGVRVEQRKVTQWYGEQLASLLERLKRIPEGSGSVLDNTLVVWASDMATGGHGWLGGCMLLGGRCGGAVRPGRTVSGVVQNDLYAGVATAMGAPTEKFGNPIFASGPYGLA